MPSKAVRHNPFPGKVRRHELPDRRVRGKRGQQERARWLREHPLCAECDRQGRVTKGQEVDHIVPLSQGGKDDDTNKQTLCKPCHKDKTIRERGDRRRGAVAIS